MKRKIFDMNQCKPGDLLVSRDGHKVEYVGKSIDVDYPHLIVYLYNGAIGDNGRCFDYNPSGRDIIGFWKE